ncbi:MAG TPA: phage major capsid protein, partial [Candidatus Hydrogenedentes bacterium]|nr:phage major capsid protein [Candidatus Hydrogenedentota bacterium]
PENNPSEEDMTRAEGLLGEVEKLTRQIDLMERHGKETAWENQSRGVKTMPGYRPPSWGADMETDLVRDCARQARPGVTFGFCRDRTYRGMFCRNAPESAVLDNGGFPTFDDFLRTVHAGLADDRLMRAMATTAGDDGGFAVPTQFAAWLLDMSLEDEIVRPRATPWAMSSNRMKVPAWKSNDHTGSLYGGIVANWIGESETISETNPKLRGMELIARKLAILCGASHEVLADGGNLEGQLSAAMIKAMGWYLDYAFLQGDGVAKPLGVLNSSTVIEVTRTLGDSICYTDIVNMFARMHPGCLKNAVWVANTTTIPYLLTLTIASGAGATHVPVLQESNGKYRMLTKEVIFTEKVPALGSAGDLCLCDFSQYMVGMRQDASLEKSIHVGFQTDDIWFRLLLRAEGQAAWDKVVTPLNGDTLSWCVTLSA